MRVPSTAASAAVARVRLSGLPSARCQLAAPRDMRNRHNPTKFMHSPRLESSMRMPSHWKGTNLFFARRMSIDKYSLFGGDEAGEQRTSVDSYNKHGFMVNGVLIQGAVILLPETTLLWNVSKMEDITSESLVALRLLLIKPGASLYYASHWLSFVHGLLFASVCHSRASCYARVFLGVNAGRLKS